MFIFNFPVAFNIFKFSQSLGSRSQKVAFWNIFCSLKNHEGAEIIVKDETFNFGENLISEICTQKNEGPILKKLETKTIYNLTTAQKGRSKPNQIIFIKKKRRFHI